MSYMAFTKELSREFGALQRRAAAKPTAVEYQEAERRVFDRWLADRRYEGLVDYLVENLDGSEGGEEWFRLAAVTLAKANRFDLLRALYRPVLERRSNFYFYQRAQLRRWPRVLGRLLERVNPTRLKLAKYKQSLLAVMQDFRAAANAGQRVEIDAMMAALQRDEKPLARPLGTDRRHMDEPLFWLLFAEARTAGETDHDALASLTARLAAFAPREIEQFNAVLGRVLRQAYRWDLWAVAYAVRGGCGDDEFDYFRAWLVLQGHEVYQAALADPITWALQCAFERNPQCEGLLAVASEAFALRTGGTKLLAAPTVPLGEPAGERWSEGDLARRFPALAARFDLG
jgi:hypothetical protein